MKFYFYKLEEYFTHLGISQYAVIAVMAGDFSYMLLVLSLYSFLCHAGETLTFPMRFLLGSHGSYY